VSDVSALGIELDEAGLCLRALGLWLDPTAPTSAAFVSHAHGARALASGRVIASPETLALARASAPNAAGGEARALGWGEAVELPVDRAFGGGTARLSIAPAGHALGAAQLVVEHPRGTLVYTGDYSAEADPTHARGAPVACDEVIVTSTFALPIFRFEPHEATRTAIVDWCAARLASEVTPVVLAQNPGPAQSVVQALIARGVATAAHEDVRRVCEAYEALGVPIGAVGAAGAFATGTARRGVAVVAPPAVRATELRSRAKTEVAYASGWALLDAAVEQKRADAAFGLADHADHDGLVALVQACGATRVHVTRGDARAFAHTLRARGIDADAIELGPIDDRGAS
jgi:putative mRNA 3-end processing factor